MISIGICLLTYNCVDELRDCLESVSDFYPVIIIDGKWKDFEGDHACSTDGTIELAESYSNVVMILSPNGTEADNRNLSIEYAIKYGCNVVIVLDSDERLELSNGKEAFYRSLERKIRENPNDLGFKVVFNSEKRGGASFLSRIFLNPKSVKYMGIHDRVWSKGQEIRNYASLCPNIMINEDQNHRTKERLEKMIQRNYANPKH